jgi:hypothetical protein
MFVPDFSHLRPDELFPTNFSAGRYDHKVIVSLINRGTNFDQAPYVSI